MSEELRLATGVSHEMLDSLGAIVVNFAALEFSVSACISMLLADLGLNGSSNAGHIVTASQPFRNLRVVCAALFRERFGDDNADYETLMEMLDECQEVEELRNALIHSLWVRATSEVDEPHGDRLKLSSNLKRFKIQEEAVKRSELIALANQMTDLDLRLRQFMPTKIFEKKRGGEKGGA